MLASLAVSLWLGALAVAQLPEMGPAILFDEEHNATSLIGVWSTGAGLVETGVNFVDVKNGVFNPPPVAGMSYSFTGNGDFEMVEFRFESNPTKPMCPGAKLLFQHGKYELRPDGVIILNPYPEDGLVQTQSPCAAKSSTIQQFNATIIISYWRIWIDPPTNKAHLHLFAHDGMPYNKMILRYADPDVESHMQALETILKPEPKPPRRLMRRNAAPSDRLGAAGAVLGVVCTAALVLSTVLF
jgi:hypothetical protein